MSRGDDSQRYSNRTSTHNGFELELELGLDRIGRFGHSDSAERSGEVVRAVGGTHL